MSTSEDKTRWIIGTLVVVSILLFVGIRSIAADGTPPVATLTPSSQVRVLEQAPSPVLAPTPDPALGNQKTIDARVDGLFGEALDPADVAGQQKLVDDYRQLRAMAQRNRLVFQTGCGLATRAYQVQAFLLAKEAFEDCYLDGQLQNDNKPTLRAFAASLRNLGRNWLEHGQDDRTRYKGETYLVLCVSVVERFSLPVHECEQDLLQLVGTRSIWPPAAASPLVPSR